MNLRPLALISVFALALPACSGDDGDTASTTNATNTTNTTNTTATTSTSGSTSETSGGSGSGSGSEGSTSGSTTGDPSTSGSSTGDPSTSGTTADPSTSSTSTGGTTGGGGDAPYDPETCDGQPLGVMGIEGAFCSAECTMNADCPMGPMGTMGMCVLSTMGNMTPTNCALICQLDNDACPEGSTCKDIMQMGAGICTYP